MRPWDANGDGIEDGIVPPDGNSIATGDTNNYYEAYARCLANRHARTH